MQGLQFSGRLLKGQVTGPKVSERSLSQMTRRVEKELSPDTTITYHTEKFRSIADMLYVTAEVRAGGQQTTAKGKFFVHLFCNEQRAMNKLFKNVMGSAIAKAKGLENQ